MHHLFCMHNQPCRQIASWSWSLAIVLFVAQLAPCLAVAQTVDDEASPLLPVETELQAQKPESSPMNNRRLGKLLKKHFPDRKVEGQLGIWRIVLPEEKQAADVDVEPKAQAKKEAVSQPVEEIEPTAETNGKPVEQKPEQQEPAQDDTGLGAGERLPPVVLVLTDERANRMRIMMAIRPFDSQRIEDLQLALIALHANYDRALDARYAIHEGVLWSAFIHPLSSLTPSDLASALSQVQTLRETTGTTYNSGNLMFAAPVGEEEKKPAQEGPKPRNPDDNVT